MKLMEECYLKELRLDGKLSKKAVTQMNFLVALVTS